MLNDLIYNKIHPNHRLWGISSEKIAGLTYMYGVLQLSSNYDRVTHTTTTTMFGTDIIHNSNGSPAVINHKTGYKEWWIDGEMVDCSHWKNLREFISNHSYYFNILFSGQIFKRLKSSYQ